MDSFTTLFTSTSAPDAPLPVNTEKGGSGGTAQCLVSKEDSTLPVNKEKGGGGAGAQEGAGSQRTLDFWVEDRESSVIFARAVKVATFMRLD
ncbi:hypothetical protein BDV98DRAFT_591139 [Pterulicium gracile]|uniref:Uncharacterized protein n=1 Tax=Pterulicium gracile TaxID=1884261 RepID=A0A5C3QRT4_9AGAR|nr:hypothetical protein BDV98DRAFT_591139 [Pterula gracilis]